MTARCEFCDAEAVALLADDRALGRLSMKLCRVHLDEAANAPGISESARADIIRTALKAKSWN